MRPISSNQTRPRAFGFAGLVALLTLIVLGTPLQAQGPGGEPVETYEKVLARSFPPSFLDFFPLDEEDDEPVIVPISRLQASLSQQAGNSPIPNELLEDFVAHSNQAAARLDRKRCNISPASYSRAVADPKNPSSTHLLEFLPFADVVLLGTIEQVVAAWSFDYDSVVSIVHMRVEEVIKDLSESFASGQQVTYVQQWGEASILGIPHCTNPPRGISAPDAPGLGDRILLTGTNDLRNPAHLITHHAKIYPVTGEIVSPPAGALGFSEATATLDDVRERLQ